MKTDRTSAIGLLGKLCEAGADRFSSYGFLDPAFLSELVLPELSKIVEADLRGN